MHSEMIHTIISRIAQEWSRLRGHDTLCWCSYNVPACYKNVPSIVYIVRTMYLPFTKVSFKKFTVYIQCACILSKCSYNVPVFYPSVPRKLTMCLRFIKVFLESLQCACVLSKCSLKAYNELTMCLLAY